jgi:hypothetical protein
MKIIDEGSNRIILSDGEYVYKIPKNKCGLECNKNELLIGNKYDFTLKYELVDKEKYIIKTNLIDIKQDESDFIKLFGLKEKDLIRFIEYNYFLNDHKRQKRINYDMTIFNIPLMEAYGLIKNENVDKLLNICLNENIEPVDLVRGISFNDNEYGFILFDFGFTEKTYFNTTFRLNITESRESYSKSMGSIMFFRLINSKRYKSTQLNNEFHEIGLNYNKIINSYNKLKPKNNCLYYSIKDRSFY